MATQRPVGRCDHRHDQGQFPDPHLLPGHLQDRQPDDLGRTGCRAAAGHGRHALHGRRRTDYAVSTGRLCRTKRSRTSLCISRCTRRARLRRQASSTEGIDDEAQVAVDLDLEAGPWRQHIPGRTRSTISAVAIVARDRKVLDLLHPAQAGDRLQQGRAPGRADGRSGRRHRGQRGRQARDPDRGTLTAFGSLPSEK